MGPLIAMIIILAFQIFAYTIILVWLFHDLRGKKNKPEEIDIENQARTAAYTLAEYCLCQKDEGRCRFNENENNTECKCKLLKTPPEEWLR